MTLINWEINLFLTWSANYFIIDAPLDRQVPSFTITDTKLYLPVVTLSTQDNAKLLTQLKSGFKKTIDYNRYLSKSELLAQNSKLKSLSWIKFSRSFLL